MQLRPLAETGILLCKNWRDAGLSRQALSATPALWQGDSLIAAPFLPDADNADKSVLIKCVFNDERLVINDLITNRSSFIVNQNPLLIFC